MRLADVAVWERLSAESFHTGAAACGGCSTPPPTRARYVATASPGSACTHRCSSPARSTGPPCPWCGRCGPVGQGYAYVGDDQKLALLAASDRRRASSLLWSVLADGPPSTDVAHVTAADEWAVDVGLAAGLAVHTEGYLALRGMRPPAPYLHHGALLQPVTGPLRPRMRS